MSERGVYAIDRGVWEHECFADEPFTEREAWMWLCGAASWRASRRRIGSVDVALERGQLAASLRFLGERFQWGKNKVARFLERIEKRDMIRTANGTGLTVITICNYDQYQKVSLPRGTAGGTQSGTAAGQQRDKVESNKNIQEDSEAKASDAGASPIYEDSTHELWAEGVAILGQLGVPEKSARSNIGRWLKDARSDASRVLGAIQRARDARTGDPIPFVTGALRTNHKPRGGSFLELALEIGENEKQPGYPPKLITGGRS